MRSWRTVHKAARRRGKRQQQRVQLEHALAYIETPKFKVFDSDIQDFTLRWIRNHPCHSDEVRALTGPTPQVDPNPCPHSP